MNKNPLVDHKVSIRKLGEKTIGLRMVHACSDGDINRGVTVSVSLVSTARTLEGSLFPYAFASASGANMRCSSWMDCNHKPVVLPSYRFECHSEPAVGHTFSFAVTLSVSSGVFKPLEVFDGYESVVLFSELYDFMSDLPASCSGVVAFFFSKSSKRLPCMSATVVSMPPEIASSKADVSLVISHILTKVELLQNTTFTVNYGNCRQPFHSNIDTDDCLVTFFGWKLLLKNYMNSVLVEPEESRFVSFSQQFFIPTVSSIHSDWHSDSSIESGEGNHWIAVLCHTKVSASRNVEGNRNITYFSTVVQYGDSILEQVVSNLTVQPELSNTLIEEALKFYLGCLDTLEHHERERLFIGTSKVFNSLVFNPAGLKKIQGYGFNNFHPKTTRKIDFQVFKFLQFLPPINRWASLERRL